MEKIQIENKVNEFIEKFDKMALHGQYRTVMMLERYLEERKAIDKIRDEVSKDKGRFYNVLEVIPIKDDMYIVQIEDKDNRNKTTKETYWYHNKFSSHFYHTFEEAVLGWMEYTHLGLNSQFTSFAVKMLGVDYKKDNEIKELKEENLQLKIDSNDGEKIVFDLKKRVTHLEKENEDKLERNIFFDDILKILGWEGGTIHQVIQEIKKLKQTEEVIQR